MGSIVSTEFDFMVLNGKVERCIELLEDGLRSIKRTPYHRVLGKDFLRQTDDLARRLISFHKGAAAEKLKLAAIYLEMNGFTHNTDEWHCHLFGYERAGDVRDLGWLSAWDAEPTPHGCFVLEGMESVQETFAELFGKDKQPLHVKLSGEITMYLVTARFMQLVAAAHKTARRRYQGLRKLSVLATAHGWDTVHRTM
jgi:hypothetical protein